MSAVFEAEFDTKPYRAKLNPDFLRRVRARQRQEASDRAKAKEAAAAVSLAASIAKVEETRIAAAAERLNELQRAAERIAALEAEVHELKMIGMLRPQDMRHVCNSSTPYRKIEARACRVFGVTRQELQSQMRNDRLVMARHFVMYWCGRLTNLSTKQTGRLLGGKDHTTVIHGRQTYPARRAKMGRYVCELVDIKQKTCDTQGQ